MSSYETYTDWQGDGSTLEVSTGGPLGVLFIATDGPHHVVPSLDRAAVEQLVEQLQAWLAMAK